MNAPIGPFLSKPGAQPERVIPLDSLEQAALCRDSPALNMLLEATDHLALVLDMAGGTVAASAAMLEVLGLDRIEPILGLSPGDVISCLWAAHEGRGCGGTVNCPDCAIHLAVQECRLTRAARTQESLLSLQNAGAGSLGEFKLRATPLQLGEASFTFLTLQDLSERKRRESLERFFLNQVLNLTEGLEGTVRILAAEPESAPLLIQQLKDFTGQLAQEVHGQRILVQAENGSLQVEAREIELTEILESLHVFFRNHDVAHKRHLALPRPPPERFLSDPSLLLRILIDLVMNAFKATPVGGTVRLDYQREPGGRTFTVHNAGSIPPALMDQIFQRSFSTKAAGGWGLGTFGLRLLAERYLEGRLRFTTGATEGTTFALQLPAIEPLQESAPLSGVAADVLIESIVQDRVKLGTVLVADDAKVTRHLLQSILVKDFRVVLAEDGQEALTLARECRPDVMVLDVIMPEVDGYSVCRQAKHDPKLADIPIIFLTSLTGKTYETQALEAGAIDFITKPINPDVVYARVRNHVEMKQAQDRLKDLSLHDSLTGIANRRAFDQALEHEWRRGIRSRRPMSVIMGDVDHFKRYNDAFGHQQGDVCLQRVAQVFAAAVRRPSDTVARYGGEEYVCVLGDTDMEGARLVAEKIRAGVEALALPHPDSDAASCVTVSLGIAAVVPDHKTGFLTIVDQADQRLYQAKRSGRNRIAG